MSECALLQSRSLARSLAGWLAGSHQHCNQQQLLLSPIVNSGWRSHRRDALLVLCVERRTEGRPVGRTNGHTCCCWSGCADATVNRSKAQVHSPGGIFYVRLCKYIEAAGGETEKARPPRLAPAAEPTRLCAERQSSACCITRNDNGPDVISLVLIQTGRLAASCLCSGFVCSTSFASGCVE